MPARAKITLRKEEQTPAPKGGDVPAASVVREDRVGKRIISGHFPKSVWADVRRLAVDEDRTLQSLLDEAITDLLAKYRRRSS